MNTAERIAKCIIEAHRSGFEMRYRTDQSDGQRDYDLVYGGDIVAAVECTMATDQAMLQMRARISNPKSGGEFVQAQQCKKGWSVDFTRNADPRLLRKCIDAYLAPIEAAGIVGFFSDVDAYKSCDIRRISADLHVDAAFVTEWNPPRNRIWLNTPAQGGEVEFNQLWDAVNGEAQKLDNRKKLAQVSNDIERHLFVYVDPTHYLPWKILADAHELYPDGFPEVSDLPEKVFHLWVATNTRSANEYVAWFLQKGSPWQGPTYISIPEVDE